MSDPTIRLAEIRERWADARSTPWTVDVPTYGDSWQGSILGANGLMIACYVDPEEQEAIAAAPEDVAFLADLAEEQQREVERVTKLHTAALKYVEMLKRHHELAIHDLRAELDAAYAGRPRPPAAPPMRVNTVDTSQEAATDA